MTDHEDYVYEIIENETDALVCAQLLAEEFSKREPMTSFAHISAEAFFDGVIWPTMLESLEDRVSVLARHRSTNEIVGAILANDLYSAYKKHPSNPNGPAHTFALIDFITEMDDIFIKHDFGQELKPGMVLHIFVGATRQEHEGKSIGSRLRSFVCNHAKETKGYQYAFVQATNPATRHIYLNKMHGKIVSELDPVNWLWKKKDDGTSCPYKEFTGGIIPNILINLN